jgi:hypothetical protein
MILKKYNKLVAENLVVVELGELNSQRHVVNVCGRENGPRSRVCATESLRIQASNQCAGLSVGKSAGGQKALDKPNVNNGNFT